ncbi:MAG: FAD-dependent monooxygenase [Gemmobacter sp.]
MTLIGKDICVLGAGVAGLAVARALALRGAHVTVLEQADAIREVGAGLQLSPNGLRVLAALGLDLPDDWPVTEAAELRDGATDALLVRLDLGRRWPGGFRLVHRADLIAILAQGARDAGVDIRLRQRGVSVDMAEDGPVLHTGQGAILRPSLLIGADGLHSVVRAALEGPARPFFTRQTAWRAVIAAEPGVAPVAEVHLGPGRHLVTYPLRGGTLRNIVAVEERDHWVQESWSLQDDAMEMRLAFADFSPRVRGWLERVDYCWLWGLFRHPVARRWGWTGRERGVAILGDAAHPTLPFLAQGANMALEDAWALTAALAGHDGAAAALAAYQAARAPRCARIVAAADDNARAYHLSGPARTIGYAALRLAGAVAPDRIMRRLDWLYDFDVTAG